MNIPSADHVVHGSGGHTAQDGWGTLELMCEVLPFRSHQNQTMR